MQRLHTSASSPFFAPQARHFFQNSEGIARAVISPITPSITAIYIVPNIGRWRFSRFGHDRRRGSLARASSVALRNKHRLPFWRDALRRVRVSLVRVSLIRSIPAREIVEANETECQSRELTHPRVWTVYRTRGVLAAYQNLRFHRSPDATWTSRLLSRPGHRSLDPNDHAQGPWKPWREELVYSLSCLAPVGQSLQRASQSP